VIVLTDADGVDELFFGAEGIVKGLCTGASVLIRSTLLPSQLEKLEQKLAGIIFCLSIHLQDLCTKTSRFTLITFFFE